MDRIGIGITTYNRNRQLSDTLKRIKSLSKKGVKIVIVDDGSKVPVKEATYRFQTNQGAPIAKNKCLELLDGCDHIFLFDDDTYPIKKGWEDVYINAKSNHLNYTFKYDYDVKKGLRHLENPNGCMMYITKEVLNKVGGFDTGFVKYGYWHGSYSNRVYNAGLIPHPFMDIINSKEYIYCLDENGKKHKTSRTDRSKYLRKNKQRYFEKINSKEYISFKDIKIWYSNPYNTSKNIGKALNDFCNLVPDDDWICLQDGDMMYLTPDWGKQIEDVVKTHGEKYGLIGCMTNRLARPIQRVGEFDDNHEILYHYEIAKEIKDANYGVVEDITKNRFIAGLFMLFPKKVWKEIKFKENNAAFDDAFSKDLIKKGYKLGLMKGLYVYHFYRGWSDNPTKERAHLL